MTTALECESQSSILITKQREDVPPSRSIRGNESHYTKLNTKTLRKLLTALSGKRGVENVFMLGKLFTHFTIKGTRSNKASLSLEKQKLTRATTPTDVKRNTVDTKLNTKIKSLSADEEKERIIQICQYIHTETAMKERYRYTAVKRKYIQNQALKTSRYLLSALLGKYVLENVFMLRKSFRHFLLKGTRSNKAYHKTCHIWWSPIA